MLVKSCMSRDPVTVTPDDTLAQALELTSAHRIRHLPVVGKDGRLCGILSDGDIRLAMPSPLTVPDAERADFLERTPVAAVMQREVVTLTAEEPIEEAARQLYQHRISALPIIDPAGHLEGILTETDVLHAFVQLLGGMEPSCRLEVALQDQPGQLARALRVVGEEQGANLVSLVVPSTRAAGRAVAVLHLGIGDPQEVITSLESAGFEVGWPSLATDRRSASQA